MILFGVLDVVFVCGFFVVFGCCLCCLVVIVCLLRHCRALSRLRAELSGF